VVLRVNRRCLALAAALVLLAVLVLRGDLLDRAISVFKASRRLPIYSVATEEKKVALTFDAAWGAERTPRILEILRENDIKATFFLVSFWVEDYPEMARRIAEEGHEIGLHSTTHPDMTTLSREDIIWELEENRRIIEEVTGRRPWLFRPPFGAYSDRLLAVAEDELGLVTIQWDVDSLDWHDLSGPAMVERVTRRVKPGSIILFHNNGKHTPEALPGIIAYLRSQGYEMVPVSELLHRGEYYIDHQGRQVAKPGSSLEVKPR